MAPRNPRNRNAKHYIGYLRSSTPVEDGGAIVYKTGYGYAMDVFQHVEGDVYVFEGVTLDKWIIEDYDLKDVFRYAGVSMGVLEDLDLTDPMILAELFMMIGDYYGYESAFSEGSEQMTLREAKRKFGRAESAAYAAMQRRRNPKPKPFRIRKAPSMTRKALGPALPPELAVARWLSPTAKRASKKTSKKTAKPRTMRVRVSRG
jgi:hypothetical protein